VTDEKKERQTGRQAARQSDRQSDTGTERERQADRQTDRQTSERQREREREGTLTAMDLPLGATSSTTTSRHGRCTFPVPLPPLRCPSPFPPPSLPAPSLRPPLSPSTSSFVREAGAGEGRESEEEEESCARRWSVRARTPRKTSSWKSCCTRSYLRAALYHHTNMEVLLHSLVPACSACSSYKYTYNHTIINIIIQL